MPGTDFLRFLVFLFRERKKSGLSPINTQCIYFVPCFVSSRSRDRCLYHMITDGRTEPCLSPCHGIPVEI